MHLPRGRAAQRSLRLAPGVFATAVAPLVFAVPLRELLAYVLNDYRPPADPSWAFIARRYPSGVLELIRCNIGFLRRGQWYTAIYLLGGISALFLSVRRESRVHVITFSRAMTLASVAYLLMLPNFSAFRLELVFLPMAAFGMAAALEWIATSTGLTSRLPEADCYSS